MERYSLNDVAVVMYHLHIPLPDPMTNPSTLARAESLKVLVTPSYAIDGNIASGGGSREESVPYYTRLNSQIEERLVAPAEARILLDAFQANGKVNTKVTVDRISGNSSELRLQIALIEDELSYSGQNNLRFHPMTVRSLGGEGHLGFVIDPSKKTTVEHSFDLDKITEELKAHLDNIEKEREITFIQKKHEMDKRNLSVVAFVQDMESRNVLQSAFIKVRPDSDSNSVNGY